MHHVLLNKSYLVIGVCCRRTVGIAPLLRNGEYTHMLYRKDPTTVKPNRKTSSRQKRRGLSCTCYKRNTEEGSVRKTS